MQFTSTIIALVAALAMVDPTQAGILGGLFGGKRSVLNTRSFEHFTRQLSAADKSIALMFKDCMNEAKNNEILDVSHVNGNVYKLASHDGSWPESCEKVADSYIEKAQAVDGKLSKNPDGTFNLAVLPKDKENFDALVTHTTST